MSTPPPRDPPASAGDPADPADPSPADLDSEQGWRVLGLVIDWLKHGEAKAAATLATTGVSAGVLYNLVKDQHHPHWYLSTAIAVCFALLVIAGLLAAWALRPRLRARDSPTSPLYFHHIARAHPRAGGSGAYRQAVRRVSSDREHLVDEVADQIWNNALVATDKYKYTNYALASLLLAIIALGAVTTILALESL